MIFLAKVADAVFHTLLPEIKKVMAKECADLKEAMEAIRQSMAAVKAATGRNPSGRNWCVLVYRLGDRDVVKLYDFGTRNTVAIRDMMDRFERAGITVQENDAGWRSGSLPGSYSGDVGSNPAPATKTGGSRFKSGRRNA